MKISTTTLLAVLLIGVTSGVAAQDKSKNIPDLCSLYEKIQSALNRHDLEEAKAVKYPGYLQSSFNVLREAKASLFVRTYHEYSAKLREVAESGSARYLAVISLNDFDISSKIISEYLNQNAILEDQLQKGTVVFVDHSGFLDDVVKISVELKAPSPSLVILERAESEPRVWKVRSKMMFLKCDSPESIRAFVAENTEK